MFYVPRSPRAFNLYHNGNLLRDAPTDFLRKPKSDAKIISLMAKKIKSVARIDTQPEFTQSIISDLYEMHLFEKLCHSVQEVRPNSVVLTSCTFRYKESGSPCPP